jgi:nucleotidyltransferase/DNA polymerase involved in DNA repair
VLARLQQKSIFDARALSCSIGVAPNKLLAKLASEFNKPNGISVVHEADLQTLIWPLPCRKINGIGPKTDAKPAGHGIHTIGELAARERAWLIARFGNSHGAWLHDAAWGRDERPVVTDSEPVSLSRETTFERDLHAVHDRAELGAVFTLAVPRRWPPICSARATRAAPSASSCASTTFASPRATRRWPSRRRTRAASARWRASASSVSICRAGCACWACGWARWCGWTVSPPRRIKCQITIYRFFSKRQQLLKSEHSGTPRAGIDGPGLTCPGQHLTVS